MRKPTQLSFQKINGWGGARKGAGRPNRSTHVNHMKRPQVSLKTPLHITLRLKDKLPNLRRKALLKEFKRSIQGAKVFGLGVLHFSLQRNHIHMIVEAPSNAALEKGMRSLVGSFAKAVRKEAALKGVGATGSVFDGRYHLHVLKTPTEVKHALRYVLLNFSKHADVIEHLDPYSSAAAFRKWRELIGVKFRDLIEDQLDESGEDFKGILSPPRSWLASIGWTKARAGSKRILDT